MDEIPFLKQKKREIKKLIKSNKERTINDLGGAGAKAGKKNLSGYSPGKKKTQLNNPEEKVQRLVAKEKKFNSRLARKKNSTVGWPGKKTQ